MGRDGAASVRRRACSHPRSERQLTRLVRAQVEGRRVPPCSSDGSPASLAPDRHVRPLPLPSPLAPASHRLTIPPPTPLALARSCTSQYLHRSLLAQPHVHLRPALLPFIDGAASSTAPLFAPLGPFERRLKREWAPPPGTRRATAAPASATICVSAGTQNERVGRARAPDDGADEPARRARPSSVTSFTDNESAPSSPPSPSSSTSFSSSPPPSPALSPAPPLDTALAHLSARRGTRRVSPVRPGWDRFVRTLTEHGNRYA